MNKLLYLKVFVLVAALVMVFYVMTRMSPDKVAKGIENMGLAPVQPTSKVTPIGDLQPDAHGLINLCRTRVNAIVWPDGRKIQEAKGGLKANWQAYNLTPVDIGSMDVEKWLSLHCQVPVTFRDADASVATSAAPIKPYVSINYIDGTHEDLDRSDDGVYRFAGRLFTSRDLTEAMTELISLANLKPQGP